MNKGYVAIQRPGGYNVLIVDLYWNRAPRLGAKVPDEPQSLGLTSPFPQFQTVWVPSDREWGWTVPPGSQTPDVGALIDLAPQDSARIEKAVSSVIGDIDASPATFYGRSQRSLDRIANKLVAWNKDQQHGASLARIRAQMATVCAKLPESDPSRATCDRVLGTRKGTKA